MHAGVALLQSSSCIKCAIIRTRPVSSSSSQSSGHKKAECAMAPEYTAGRQHLVRLPATSHCDMRVTFAGLCQIRLPLLP